MATSQDVINEWIWDNDEKQKLAKTHPDFILRWLNQALLRFADKSEILRSTWTPTTASDGTVALPADFLREFPDRVKWQTDYMPLKKVNYPDAIQRSWASLCAYSIYNGTFYVWSPAAVTLTVEYIQKPALLTDLTADLVVPVQFHKTLISYLDAFWIRKGGDLGGYYQFIKECDIEANSNGMSEILRLDGAPRMRTSWF